MNALETLELIFKVASAIAPVLLIGVYERNRAKLSATKGPLVNGTLVWVVAIVVALAPVIHDWLYANKPLVLELLGTIGSALVMIALTTAPCFVLAWVVELYLRADNKPRKLNPTMVEEH